MVPPGMTAPPGEKTDYDNPDREMQYWTIVANAVGIPVCTVLVVLRMWARKRLRMSIQADDIMVIFAYFGFLGYCTICLLMLRFGGGLHQWDVPATEVVHYAQTVYATMVFYAIPAFTAKAAILLFLIRVFSPYRIYAKVIYGFLGVLAIYYVLMFFLKVFICRPISMFWDPTEDGECFNQRALILTDNVISLVSDLIILLIPCPMTRNLQVGWKSKLKVGVVFGLGGVACIFSLIRLVFIVKNGNSLDQTYAFTQINLTGIAEVGIGISCACFPLMPALWKSVVRKERVGESGGYSNRYSRGYSNGYSDGFSGARTNFEMMDAKSKTRVEEDGTITYSKELSDNDERSDENVLINPAKSQMTTEIHAGTTEEATHIGNRTAASGRERHDRMRSSIDDSKIMRTVEVHQHTEKQ